MDSTPLVSCIMPTRNRRPFVGQAIKYFLRQDYQNKELIVVDDGDDDISDLMPTDKRIRYLRLKNRLKLGAKRNFACKMSRGELIAHWDDDDWMAQHRLTEQVSNLCSNNVDICGADELLYYCCTTGDAWLFRFCGIDQTWLSGGTLLYKKNIWQEKNFPEIDSAEDTSFIFSIKNKQILPLKNVNWYVAIIHGTNTAKINFADPSWQPQSLSKISGLFARDREFYVAIRNGFPVPCQEFDLGNQIRPQKVSGLHTGDYLTGKHQPVRSRLANLPLVSCIMPTHNRRQFVKQSIHYYRHQDYPNRELIIVDDGSDSVKDLISDDENISHIRLSVRCNIGHKRNLACRHARGGIIIMWDDDDWYAPNRISYQVKPIIDKAADVTALQQGLLYCIQTQQFWTYTNKLQNRMFLKGVIGGTLCFRKELWEKKAHFPDKSIAEDADFLRNLMNQGCHLKRLNNQNTFIYVRHGENSWQFTPGSFLDREGWLQVDRPSFIANQDFEFYRLGGQI